LRRKIDPYRRGFIDFNDYLLCFYQLANKDTGDAKIREAFSMLDKDN
jgi:Ca2+-binding EF-hand superfamily protein